MQLYIWCEFDISYKLLVDPEGRILIPTVGDFGVSGQTLASIREQVYKAAKEKYDAREAEYQEKLRLRRKDREEEWKKYGSRPGRAGHIAMPDGTFVNP